MLYLLYFSLENVKRKKIAAAGGLNSPGDASMMASATSFEANLALFNSVIGNVDEHEE